MLLPPSPLILRVGWAATEQGMLCSACPCYLPSHFLPPSHTLPLPSTSLPISPPLPAQPALGCTQTQLKYAVEIMIPRATRMLGVLEPLLERTVFEDVPANLSAIKQRVETIQVWAGAVRSNSARRRSVGAGGWLPRAGAGAGTGAAVWARLWRLAGGW